jgi:hypothetical protein
MAVTGLDVSGVVNVQVTISPLAVPVRNFGVPLIIGSSDVIDVYERRRLYASLDQVGEDFNTTDDEYKAAAAFFGQNPRPSLAYVGRWAQTATHGILYSGVLSPSDQLIANFSVITSGAMFLYMDGVPKTISGLNFAAATNLNGVASLLQTQLAAAVPSSTVVWDDAADRFRLTSGTTGPTSELSWAAPPTAWASVTFTGQPTDEDKLTIAGTLVTFVDSSPGANEILKGGTLAETLQNAVVVLGQSVDAGLASCVYSTNGSVLYIVAAASGTGGNSITLVETLDFGNVMTLGNLVGGQLSGGSGTDVSSPFRLTAARGAPTPVAGVAAETAVQCITDHANGSHSWYGAMFASETQPTLAQHELIAQFVEGLSPSRTYWYTSGETLILDAQTTADIAGSMKTLNLARTAGLFSTKSPVAVASLFGRFASVDFRQNNSVITGKFKRLPGIVAETLSETQAQTLRTKRINVFVNYDNDTAIVQEAVMANGDFIDERFGADWLQNALQVALFNVLYTSPTKIPQTDAGTQVLVGACSQVCQQAVFNGFVAPGQWNGPTIGQLVTGDLLTTGFYIFAPPVSSQSQADREARRSVPITICVKLAGAVHSVVCSVYIER